MFESSMCWYGPAEGAAIAGAAATSRDTILPPAPVPWMPYSTQHMGSDHMQNTCYDVTIP